jgi:hypothetical protein
MWPVLRLKFMMLVVACSAAFTTQATMASVIWDEASSGDLSNDGLAPTSLVVGNGSNIILGTTGNAGQGIDRDYFSFTVPTGTALTSLMLLGNTSVSGGSSFIAIQAGSQLTVSPTGAGVENLLGFAHYSNDQIGADLLPFVTIGFTGPVPSGTYSVWVQDTGGPATYGFDFVVTPVPLPGTAALLLSALLGVSMFGLNRSNAGQPKLA